MLVEAGLVSLALPSSALPPSALLANGLPSVDQMVCDALATDRAYDPPSYTAEVNSAARAASPRAESAASSPQRPTGESPGEGHQMDSPGMARRRSGGGVASSGKLPAASAFLETEGDDKVGAIPPAPLPAQRRVPVSAPLSEPHSLAEGTSEVTRQVASDTQSKADGDSPQVGQQPMGSRHVSWSAAPTWVKTAQEKMSKFGQGGIQPRGKILPQFRCCVVVLNAMHASQVLLCGQGLRV